LGTYQGLHGEVSLLPFEAAVLEDTSDKVSLRTWTRTYRSPLKLERIMTLKRDTGALFITERLHNEAPVEFAVMWGHHPAFGEPFLDENCVVHAPAKKVEVLAFHPNGLWQPGGDYEFPMVPNRRTGELQDIRKVLPRSARSVDVVFFKELEDGWYSLTNLKKGVGIGMAWDHKLFRYLWMWQGYNGHDDYPWYGRTYNCALEPFTSYPPAGIQNAINNGTALFLKPNEIINTNLVMVAYESHKPVRVNPDGIVE